MKPNLQYFYMSWQDVEKACIKIHSDIVRSNYSPDIIIGLLWGGVIPTRLLVDLLGHKRLNTHVIYTSLYDGVGKRKENVDLDISSINEELSNKKVLIVDDIWDTGETMKAVLKELLQYNCEIKTATLVYKNINSTIAPNYYDKTVEIDNLWVLFPWEKHEFERGQREIIQSKE